MNKTDIIINYKPIFIKNNRHYKSSYNIKKPLLNIPQLDISILTESLINPYDLIDSHYFNKSHLDNQYPIVNDFDNETFSIYIILHQILSKYNINNIVFNKLPKYINKLTNYYTDINIKFEENLIDNIDENISNIQIIEHIKSNKNTIYCVDTKTILNPLFWKNKNGSSIIVQVNPKEHNPYLLKILNSILNLSNKSYIEIPSNHVNRYYVVAIYVHQNFHELYLNLESKNLVDKSDIIEINSIFTKIIQEFTYLNKAKNKFKDYEWTKESSEYAMILNLNYCYSVCKKYNLDINPVYLNQFGQLREIKLKYSKYISKFFKQELNIDSNNLQITNIGLYSITKPYVTKEILNIMKAQINIKLNKETTDLIITDGTGGVGGDAIMFTNNFKYTNIVEIIDIHYNVIINNLKAYHRQNYKVYNDNYVTIFDKLEQDIIYLDSPWGGIGYKEQKYTELYLFNSDISFNSFIDRLSTKTKLIFIKCPINYNVFQLSKYINSMNIEVFNVSNFLLLVLYFK